MAQAKRLKMIEMISTGNLGKTALKFGPLK